MANQSPPSTPTGARPAGSVLPSGQTSTASSTASSVKTRTPGFFGAIMGKLQGVHKNPIKHAAMKLSNSLFSRDDAALPALVAECDAVLEFSEGGGVPVNDRNPYFLIFLRTFTPIAKDIITINTGGTLSEAELRANSALVDTYISRSGNAERQINLKRGSSTHQDETNEFLNQKIDILVRAKSFYQGLLRPFQRAAAAKKAAAEEVARKASAANLQERLNRIRKMGGATKKKRSKSKQTRKSRMY